MGVRRACGEPNEIKKRLALRTYAPWGCIVRVVPGRLTKSRKIPTREALPLLLVPYGIQVIVAVNGEDAFKTLRASNVTVANNHLHDIGHLGIAYVAVHTLERPPSVRWAGVIAGAVCLFGVAVFEMTKPIEFVCFFTPEFVYFSTPEHGGVSKTSAGYQTSRSSLQKKTKLFFGEAGPRLFLIRLLVPGCTSFYPGTVVLRGRFGVQAQ